MGGDENGAGFSDGFDETEDVGDDEVVVIVDGDREVACVVLAVAEIEDKEYALLAPAEQLEDVPEDEEEGQLELFIFEYGVNEEGLETYTGIEDEGLFERVRDFFSTLIDTDTEEDEDEDEEDDDLN